MQLYRDYTDSPLGILEISATDKALFSIRFVDEKLTPTSFIPQVLKDADRQLTAYFHGALTTFSIPLSLEGTPFQLRVWRELEKIPFGSTITYGDLAKNLKKKGACRAVGGANNKNPLPIIIPCHRVIGANGALTGYAAGLTKKKWLLDHETDS